MSISIPFIGRSTGDGEAEKLTFLRNMVTVAQEARRPFEDYWFTCLAFLGGNQWEYWMHDLSNALGRRVIPAKGLSDKCRLTDDRMTTYYMQIRANLANNVPSYEAVPAPPLNEKDVQAAKLGTTALRWRDNVDNEFEMVDRELGWLLPTGEVYRLTLYDPDKGNGGDLVTEVVDVFRILKDPRAVDGMWPPRFLIHYDSWDVDQIHAKYGVKLDPEPVADQMRYFQRLALNVTAYKSSGENQTNTSALLYRAYAPPSTEYPKGKVIEWAGNHILAEHDLQNGIWPWSKGEWLPVAGRLYPRSWAELLLADQKDLNVRRSMIAEVDKRRLRGDMVVAGNDKPQQEELEDGRKIIRLRAGTQYAWETYDKFNLVEARGACNDLVGYMQEKAGVNDSTLGQLSNRDVTATEFSLVKEADLMRLGFFMRRLSELYGCRICEQKLALMAKYFVTARLMDLAGKSGAVDVPAFRGVELGNTESVIAVPCPHLSPAEKRNAQNQAGSQGLYGPWETPAHQYSCRMRLRAMGLVEDEEALARKFGPLEDVAEKAAIFQDVFDEVQMHKLLMELEQVDQTIQMINATPVPEPEADPLALPAPDASQVPPPDMSGAGPGVGNQPGMPPAQLPAVVG